MDASRFHLTFATARWLTRTSSVTRRFMLGKQDRWLRRPRACTLQTIFWLEFKNAALCGQRSVCTWDSAPFRPVQVQDLNQHVMHSERGEIYRCCSQTLSELSRRWWPNRRGWNHFGASLGISLPPPPVASWAGWQGETDIFIKPPYPVPSRRCSAHQFSLAQEHTIDAVSALAGARIDYESLCRSHRAALPFFSATAMLCSYCSQLTPLCAIPPYKTSLLAQRDIRRHRFSLVGHCRW